MIQRISSTYIKEHCTCYDKLRNNELKAVMIVPDNGYKLVYDDGKEDFEISGFVIVNVNRISSFGDYKVLEDIEEEADRGETDVSDI